MSISVVMKWNSIRIYFDDALHLHIKRSKLLAVQSFGLKGNYTIEYVMEGGTVITTEYDDVEKWKSILKGLDENGVLL